MTKVSKSITIAAVAVLIAVGIGAGVRASAQNTNQDPGSFSQPPMGPRAGGRGGPGGFFGPGPAGPLGMLRMLGPRLNLTEAQREQLKSIAETHRDEWKALGDRARA